MLNNHNNKRLRVQRWVKLIAFLGTLCVGAYILLTVNNLLISVVLAVIVSYILTPIVSSLEGTGFSRLVATSIVFVVFTFFFGALIWALSPFLARQFVSLQAELPSYIDGTVKLFSEWREVSLTLSGGLFEVDLRDRVRDLLTRQSALIVERVPGFLTSSASIILLSPFIGFFLIKDGKTLSRSLLNLVPNHIFELTLNLLHQINEQIGHYIRARILEALIVGLVVLAGLWAINTPYAVLLAAFAAITNLIPYIGPVVGAIPAIIISMINGEPTFYILAVIGVYALAQIIDMFFIIPLVVAKIVDLHPVTVVLVVIIGAQAMGVLGMIISIPVASAVKVTFISVYNHLTDFTS